MKTNYREPDLFRNLPETFKSTLRLLVRYRDLTVLPLGIGRRASPLRARPNMSAIDAMIAKGEVTPGRA